MNLAHLQSVGQAAYWQLLRVRGWLLLCALTTAGAVWGTLAAID